VSADQGGLDDEVDGASISWKRYSGLYSGGKYTLADWLTSQLCGRIRDRDLYALAAEHGGRLHPSGCGSAASRHGCRMACGPSGEPARAANDTQTSAGVLRHPDPPRPQTGNGNCQEGKVPSLTLVYVFIHSMPTDKWAVEDEAEWGDETV